MLEASGSGTPDAHITHSDASSIFNARRAEYAVVGSTRQTSSNEYVQLKRLIQQRGLLERQLVYYIGKFLFTLSLLIIGIVLLWISSTFWFQLLIALYFSFVFMQFGLLAHDLGHQQVFQSRKWSRITGFVVGNLFVGWSYSWWVDKHNAHHGHPNQLGRDPDIVRPFTAFTEEIARSRQGFKRFAAKYQAYFEFSMYLLIPPSFLIGSIEFLLRKKGKQALMEALLLIIHYGLFIGLLLWRMSPWQAVLFILVNQAFFGLYFGSIGAPNHKGMPIWDKNNPPDFMREQVLTSRNVKGPALVDFWYGGLNYQIEHHLFPTMPRNKLRLARPLVKEFCEQHGITYCETGLLQSYIDMLRFLHRVGAALREEKV